MSPLPPLILNWSPRDQLITGWLHRFPPHLWELVVKEVLKDYALYSEGTDPVPTVEALKQVAPRAPVAVAAAAEVKNEPASKPPDPAVAFNDRLTPTPQPSQEDAEQRLTKFLSKL